MKEEQLRTIIDGDQESIRSFIIEFGPLFTCVIRETAGKRNWGGKDEDLLQELFMEIFRDDARALRAWNPELGRSFKTFLCVFARLRVSAWLRLRRYNSASEVSFDQKQWLEYSRGSIDSVEQLEDRQWVRILEERFFEECKDVDRQIFERTFLSDDNIEMLAAELNLTPTALYQRRRRLRLRLLALRDEILVESLDRGHR